MVANTKRTEEEKVRCEVCLKEIPVSEAQSAEAVDYFVHFCGLDCYQRWKAQQEQEPQEPHR